MEKEKNKNTLFDYLDWRGDLSFQSVPLNEVDALIFSILSYADMKRLFSSADEALSFREIYLRYVDRGIDQSEMVYDPKPLLEACSKSRRFADLTVSHFTDILQNESHIQFSACTFGIDGETAFVAFRGTDNTLIGWREDFNLTVMNSIPAQKQAAVYMNQEFLDQYSTIYTGGHSKGGNLAVYGSAFCREEIRRKIRMIFANDNPGFRNEIYNTDEIQAALKKTRKYIPDTSVIGLVLEHDEPCIIVDSTLPPFQSHDPYSWMVLGSRFVRKDSLSVTSRFIIDVFNKWLDGISDEDRIDFINIIFDALADEGIAKAIEIRQDPLKTYRAIYNAFAKASPDKLQMVMDIFRQLAKTGKDTAVEELKKTFSFSEDSGYKK